MEINLLDRMLSTYQAEQSPVTFTLLNKIRLSGRIKAFDSYIIVVENQKREIIYRHAVSSLVVNTPNDQKRPSSPTKYTEEKPLFKSFKSSSQKRVHSQQPSDLSPSHSNSGINSGMKEGLLKWMQGQKATK